MTIVIKIQPSSVGKNFHFFNPEQTKTIPKSDGSYFSMNIEKKVFSGGSDVKTIKPEQNGKTQPKTRQKTVLENLKNIGGIYDISNKDKIYGELYVKGEKIILIEKTVEPKIVPGGFRVKQEAHRKEQEKYLKTKKADLDKKRKEQHKDKFVAKLDDSNKELDTNNKEPKA